MEKRETLSAIYYFFLNIFLYSQKTMNVRIFSREVSAASCLHNQFGFLRN